MLGKLIKYDFKAMARTMFPIYIVLLALTLIFSGMVRLHFEEGFVFTVFAVLFMFALVGSIFASVIFTVGRFSSGLLKNEAYLSFALPVNTATHIAAKVINAMIWAFFEGLALLVCLMIMGAVMGSIEDVRWFLAEIFRFLGVVEKDILFAMLRYILIVVLEMVAGICLIYAALAIAHLFDRYQKMVMVLFFVVVSVLRSSILRFSISNILIGSFDDLAILSNPIWFLTPILFAAIYSLITWYILDRKLNLE